MYVVVPLQWEKSTDLICCVFVCAESSLVVLAVSLVVGLVFLLALVIGSLMCCIRKRPPTKRCKKCSLIFISFFVKQFIKPLNSAWTWAPACVFLFTGSFQRPQDNRTRCFSRAFHEAVLVSGRHTSARLHCWSLLPVKSTNLWALLLSNHRPELEGPAEQLQRWASHSVWQPQLECHRTLHVLDFYIITSILDTQFPFVATGLNLKWQTQPTCACWTVTESHADN